MGTVWDGMVTVIERFRWAGHDVRQHDEMLGMIDVIILAENRIMLPVTTTSRVHPYSPHPMGIVEYLPHEGRCCQVWYFHRI